MNRFRVFSTTAHEEGAQGWRLLTGALLGVSSGLLLLSGCATGHNGLLGGAKPGAVAGGKLTGHVKGGNPPVTNSTITLYAASTAGYVNASTQVAVTTSDVSGNFSFSGVNCSADDQLYVVATGGNPGLGDSGNNPNLSMMAAVGSCSAVLAGTPSFVNINEVTTIASVYALANFMGDAAHVGTSPTNVTGLKNAFATVPNLVDIPSGTALSITPAYAASNVPNYHTSQAPQARINALANALASCVNSSGGSASDTSTSCGQLFSYTTVGSKVPVDTLQAALSIAQNQANNTSQIAGLITANPFFQPTLTTAQTAVLTDWALAVVYRGGGLATAGVQGDLTPSAQTLTIDKSGNIWVPGTFNGSNGFLAVFSNQGAPLPISPSAAAGSPGGYTGVANPQAIAIDQDGNAWVGGGTTGSLTVIDSTGAVKGNPSDPALLIPAQHGIAMDQFGNMWVSSNIGNCAGGNGGANGGSVLEFAPGPDYSQELGAGGYVSNATNDTCPKLLSIDSTNNLWIADDGNWNVAYDNNYNGITQISMADGSAITTPNFNTPYPYNYGLAFDTANNVWLPNNGSGTRLLYLNGAGAGPTAVTVPGDGCGCLSSSTSPVAVDGANRVWTVVTSNYSGDSGGSSPRVPGGLISYDPVAGIFAPFRDGGASAYKTNFNGYFGWDLPDPTDTTSPFLLTHNASGIGIDGSGNVWVTGPTMLAQSLGGGVGSQLVEFVGVGAPTAMPLNPSIIGVKP